MEKPFFIQKTNCLISQNIIPLKFGALQERNLNNSAES
jgi:hypothetical protein